VIQTGNLLQVLPKVEKGDEAMMSKYYENKMA